MKGDNLQDRWVSIGGEVVEMPKDMAIHYDRAAAGVPDYTAVSVVRNQPGGEADVLAFGPIDTIDVLLIGLGCSFYRQGGKLKIQAGGGA